MTSHNHSQVSIIAELLQRQRAAASLASYAEYALEVTPAAHHLLICSSIDALLADHYDDLVILAPPGSAKSTYTSHALGAYYLGRFPDRNIICATHTADLSERWSRKVRNTIASTPHQLVFPASALSKDSTAVSRWATSAGGEFLAAGTGAAILGFRADLGIIDDPVKGFEEAQSETQLSKIHDWYETDFITRLKPTGKVVTICQRLAANDVAGYIIARNAIKPTRRLHVLTLRMEAESDDPLQRPPGERLWPEWFTQQMVDDFKRDEFKWQTLFQQRPPSDTGSWVAESDIQTISLSEIPEDTSTYAVTDLALSVNKGDYTVHFIIKVSSAGDWYIVDARRRRISPEISAADIVTLAEAYRPAEWLIDDDNASKVFSTLVGSEARRRQIPVPWKTMPLRGQDKETRAAALRGQFRRRKIYFLDTLPLDWLRKEILMFPNAVGDGVDDGIDALSLLGRRMLQLAAPAAPAPRKIDLSTPTYTLNDLWSTAPALRKGRY